ncbi:helix-turn-helix domain-containing protein [Streptomyces sp. NPDC046909]|uniref:TetR/AcrR family transcriptional regulator n=1 Tax=Streptomyces sp. NPDC046909 TaxID=3155617 RepID=UPI0033CD322F
MRADAQRNAEKLRAAAAELFRERGLQAPLKEIARRAGVSHGTLYNLFGSREALIDEVVTDIAAANLRDTAERALAYEDPWDGFAYYVERLCELQATDPAIGDVVSGRYPNATRLMTVCEHSFGYTVRVIERARQDGSLRPDFTPEDLLLVLGTNALLARAAAGLAPDVWRRGVAFALDGLRTAAARPLPAGPLTPEQMYEVMGNLNAGAARGGTDPTAP